MADKVIDFQAAKERIQSSNLKDKEFSIESEIKWVEEQLDIADIELEEVTADMEELTQYILELTNYMAGISVALSIRDAGVDDWMDALKEQRQGMKRELVEEEEVQIQFELDLEDDKDYDDSELIIDFIPDGWSLDDDNR